MASLADLSTTGCVAADRACHSTATGGVKPRCDRGWDGTESTRERQYAKEGAVLPEGRATHVRPVPRPE
ncbi:MAG: hypothetical protein ABJE94_13775 [Parasphingorhabdus sp.]|uniref:hypothetical protein n=1 Tax=Parasphingorhabdus sp. TaxID=2709688 RepID=UPI00326796C0